jgi:hypothetical protein
MIDERLRRALSAETNPERAYTLLVQWKSAVPPDVAALPTAHQRRAALDAWYTRLKEPALRCLRSHGLAARELHGGSAIITASAQQLQRVLEEGVLDEDGITVRMNEVASVTR